MKLEMGGVTGEKFHIELSWLFIIMKEREVEPKKGLDCLSFEIQKLNFENTILNLQSLTRFQTFSLCLSPPYDWTTNWSIHLCSLPGLCWKYLQCHDPNKKTHCVRIKYFNFNKSRFISTFYSSFGMLLFSEFKSVYRSERYDDGETKERK